MFLNENYVLSNELVGKMGIHIANISMTRKTLEDQDDLYSIRKMNNCTFINTRAKALPQYIRRGLDAHEFTPMWDKLPVTWVHAEFAVTERELLRAGIVLSRARIAGKNFYVFSPEFVRKMQGNIGYILSEAETQECTLTGDIDGFTQLSADKYFTWYKV